MSTIKLHLWIKGTVAHAQNSLTYYPYDRLGIPGPELHEKRDASGVEFRPLLNGNDNWFHIPIPSPSIIDNRAPALSLVNILCKVDQGSITTVELFDGATLLQQYGNLNLTGDHSQAVDPANTFELAQKVPVRHGLSASVKANFPKNEGFSYGTIRFVAAGARFLERTLIEVLLGMPWR